MAEEILTDSIACLMDLWLVRTASYVGSALPFGLSVLRGWAILSICYLLNQISLCLPPAAYRAVLFGLHRLSGEQPFSCPAIELTQALNSIQTGTKHLIHGTAVLTNRLCG